MYDIDTSIVSVARRRGAPVLDPASPDAHPKPASPVRDLTFMEQVE
jgi:hypothetical protein